VVQIRPDQPELRGGNRVVTAYVLVTVVTVVANAAAARSGTTCSRRPKTQPGSQAGRGRALFLCWPSYRDPFAARALTAFAGAVLLYVGEPAGGHTADDAFFEQLAREWLCVEEVALPNWPGTRDSLTVYRRRPQSVLAR
jgi:hypothetical protein